MTIFDKFFDFGDAVAERIERGKVGVMPLSSPGMSDPMKSVTWWHFTIKEAPQTVCGMEITRPELFRQSFQSGGGYLVCATCVNRMLEAVEEGR